MNSMLIGIHVSTAAHRAAEQRKQQERLLFHRNSLHSELKGGEAGPVALTTGDPTGAARQPRIRESSVLFRHHSRRGAFLNFVDRQPILTAIIVSCGFARRILRDAQPPISAGACTF